MTAAKGKKPPAWDLNELIRSRTLGLPARLVGFTLQRRNPCLERLVFLARQPGHLLDRLKFFTLDNVEIAQNAFGLTTEQGIELTPHPLRHPCGVIHQARHFVEKSVAGLGHASSPAHG